MKKAEDAGARQDAFYTIVFDNRKLVQVFTAHNLQGRAQRRGRLDFPNFVDGAHDIEDRHVRPLRARSMSLTSCGVTKPAGPSLSITRKQRSPVRSNKVRYGGAEYARAESHACRLPGSAFDISTFPPQGRA